MKDLQAIARGEICLAFRRWKRPTVKAGGSLRTAVGVLSIDRLDPIDEETISQADAQRAGFDSREALLKELARRSGKQLYRIELHLAGDDPRQALREQSDLTTEEVSEINGRLAHFDKTSPQGFWTTTALRLIAEQPATRAPELAAAAGFEAHWFKTKVRMLKELGLTESLRIGYRLSPRGQAYLEKKALG